MKFGFKAAVMAGFLLTVAGTANAGSDLSGVWRLSSGKVTIELAPCGQSYCGKIVGLAKPLDKKGRPKRDRENPDKALRKRPLIGLMVLNDMRPDGDNRWSGTIYNADDGQTYASKMSLNGDTMIVKGCVLVFCKDMKFKRVASQ